MSISYNSFMDNLFPSNFVLIDFHDFDYVLSNKPIVVGDLLMYAVTNHIADGLDEDTDFLLAICTHADKHTLTIKSVECIYTVERRFCKRLTFCIPIMSIDSIPIEYRVFSVPPRNLSMIDQRCVVNINPAIIKYN